MLTEKGKVSSDTVQVRVVVATDLLLTEEKSSSSAAGPTTSIVSTLSHALDIAQRHQMDLIGVQLSQTPPVVKVMDKAALTQSNNKSNVSTVSSSQGNQQQRQPVPSGKKKVTTPAATVKEFKFKVGIAENDLVRKLQQVKANLQKGYTCQVIIFCPKRFYKEEEGEGGGTGGDYNSNNYNIDQRIYEHVEEFLLHEPKVKRNKNISTIVLQPKQILKKDKN
jgi:translation initiation factor IF-3